MALAGPGWTGKYVAGPGLCTVQHYKFVTYAKLCLGNFYSKLLPGNPARRHNTEREEKVKVGRKVGISG